MLISLKNVTDAFDKLNRSLEDVKVWSSPNKLKMNLDKTEFIVFGSRFQREKFIQLAKLP